MKFLIVTISAVAALAFIAASALMNWVFMTSLGRSELEQHILGGVSIAVSAFIALLPTLILWAWREWRLVHASVGLVVFAIFVAFSLSSAVGFAARNRGGLAEDRAEATIHLKDVRDEIAIVQAKRKIASNARLEAKLSDLREQERKYEALGGGREADSQAAVLASLLGLEAGKIERWMAVFLAILVELGGALGMYLALGHIWLSTEKKAVVVEVTGRPEPAALKRLDAPQELRRVTRGKV